MVRAATSPVTTAPARDDRLVADGHAHVDDGVGADEDAVTDGDRRAARPSAKPRPLTQRLRRGVGVDLHAGGDVAARADGEPAGAVDDGEGADPGALTDRRARRPPTRARSTGWAGSAGVTGQRQPPVRMRSVMPCATSIVGSKPSTSRARVMSAARRLTSTSRGLKMRLHVGADGRR